jgi:hypothetical protein
MKERILTAYERKTIERYLETGEKISNFSVILHRTRKRMATINEDLQLIQKFLKEADSPEQTKRHLKTQESPIDIPISKGKIKSFIETLDEPKEKKHTRKTRTPQNSKHRTTQKR